MVLIVYTYYNYSMHYHIIRYHTCFLCFAGDSATIAENGGKTKELFVYLHNSYEK